MTGSIAVEKIKAEKAALEELALKMWREPEVGYNEVKACKWTAEVLKKYGFAVETGFANLPTCVMGKWGSGHPVIGLLGELDALPGMSQKATDHKEPVELGAPGQACGHNLLNVACLGAAIGIKEELQKSGLEGTVVFYACPAEELLTGKAFMAREGAFDMLDLAFAWHGSKYNTVSIGCDNGLNSAIFHFKGRTAHAGGDPFNGRSALDAAELMNVGANYLREHVTFDTRIHYVYKEAGTAPNIVPDRASVWYYVRAQSREAIDDTYARLIKVAKGAAMMTETELDVEFLGGCYNTMPNLYMSDITFKTMERLDKPEYTQAELAFADKLNSQSPQLEASKARGDLDFGPICAALKKPEYFEGGGSTDVGDVDHIVPCVSVNTATYNAAAPGHSWQIASCAGMSIGLKGMLFGAETVAAAAMEMYADKKKVAEAKKEFKKAMKGKHYKCPIPREIPIPQPSNAKK